MASATCVLLFAAAAIAAIGAIASTWRTYGADVSALQTIRRTATNDLELSWRILAPASADDFDGPDIGSQIAAKPGFRPAFPSQSLAWRPSLAA